MMKASHLLPALLVLSLLLAPAHQQMTGDLSDINGSVSCSIEPPQNIQVDAISTESAQISWTGLTLFSTSFYELLYQEVSSTSYTSVQVDRLDNSTPLNNLKNYTRYSVQVRVACSPDAGFGALSTAITFTTLSNKPSASVSNLTVTPNYNNVPNLVQISWNHIPHSAWNGNVGGYLVYIYRPPNPVSITQVNFPLSEQLRILDSGTYAVVVSAFNAQGNQSDQVSDVFEFIVGDGSPEGLLEYPYVYIIVPGVIFVVIIIVINVVIFKKIHETRRRSVTYCKELAASHRGYTNAIPLQERRSPSSSMSPPGVASPSVVLTQASFANRPLPLSPNNGPSPTRQQRQHFHDQEPPAFGNGLTSNFPAPKLPHPGPLPQLSDGTDPNFAPMHRTLTNQSASSVFSPTSSIPPFPQPQQRTRAVTVGDGMPSPYEVPEHNGSTLSRGDSNSVVRPASASAAQHRVVGPRGGNFPPPPAHSPPPLTHSSMELRARMDSGDGVLTNPPGQNTLPRSMSSHHAGPPKPGGMKHIRSEGHFPIFEEKPEVYIRPLDSSVETSLHSGSSYGQNGVARKQSLETAQYPYRGGLATNGSIIESETFSSFSEKTEGSSMIPRAPPHNPAHHDRDRSVRSQGRESLFSETSIELSASSNSERGVSPAWDHRGATSDVGVGMLHDTSHSPEGRETVSEVGTGYKQHHVFKQV